MSKKLTETLSDLDSGVTDSFMVRSWILVSGGVLSFCLRLIGAGGVTWVLMVAGLTDWQLACIIILFACWLMLMFVNDVVLVKRRFFGVC